MKRGRKTQDELMRMANELAKDIRINYNLSHRVIKIEELEKRMKWLKDRGIAFSGADNFYFTQLKKEVLKNREL